MEETVIIRKVSANHFHMVHGMVPGQNIAMNFLLSHIFPYISMFPLPSFLMCIPGISGWVSGPEIAGIFGCIYETTIYEMLGR